jgi:hypothetical protein
MRADLRRLHSPDVHDLRSWSPDDAKFAVLVQIMVGPEGSPGEESVDLTLCTAEWLAGRVREEGIVDCRHHVVVACYDYEEIERYLLQLVTACEGTSWPEVALQVARIGRWEFEDYSA